jgi:hypothetical protein
MPNTRTHSLRCVTPPTPVIVGRTPSSARDPLVALPPLAQIQNFVTHFLKESSKMRHRYLQATETKKLTPPRENGISLQRCVTTPRKNTELSENGIWVCFAKTREHALSSTCRGPASRSRLAHRSRRHPSAATDIEPLGTLAPATFECPTAPAFGPAPHLGSRFPPQRVKMIDQA